METLHLMGVIVHQESRWILTPTPIEQPLEGGEAINEESDDDSNCEAIALAGSPTTVPHPRPKLEI